MAPVILESLEIKNFRAFKHLQVERLGRVNLVVGKNNVGKSALLEALSLYARRGSLPLLWELVESRGEGRRPARAATTPVTEERVLALRHLFHELEEMQEQHDPIQVGSLANAENRFSLDVRWLTGQEIPGQPSFLPAPPSPYLVVQLGTHSPLFVDLERHPSMSRAPFPEVPSVHVAAQGLGSGRIRELWDSIALTPLEEHVVAALRLIAPEVERVNVVEGEFARGRIPIVKVRGSDQPFPLRTMGDGMNHLFGIALALVSSGGGLLLVDEIENGLHYSVHLAVWRLIFQFAHHLQIQVVATTHSWDCIRAFQQAAQEDLHEGAMLLSLRASQKQADTIVAVPFDEEELEIAARDHIEVR